MSIKNLEAKSRNNGPISDIDLTTLDESPTASDTEKAAPPGRFDRADFDVVIEPRLGWRAVDFGELYRHRDLFTHWTLRNLKARHAQSALGIAWAVIQPVVNTAIFTVVFGTLVGITSDGVPYPLFALVGMVIWTYFSNAVREGVDSLTRYTNMLSKIYFPRLILPLSAVLGKLLELAVASLLVIPAMIWYGIAPRPEAIVLVPALVLVLVLTCLGVGLWLSALAVQYRDVAYALAFCIQAMMYVSPVVYSDRLVPDRYRILYGLNPVAGVIGGTRAVLLRTGPLPWDLIVPGAVTALVLAVSGLYYFRSRERLFADVA
jgi:lipopolysaccharide transport system permease protein